MSLLLPLSVDVSKDITWTFGITLDGAPLPNGLTPYTVKALIKPKNTSPDSAALHTYSSPSNGIVVTDPTACIVQWTVPNADVATFGVFWWRMDITNGSVVYDVFYGPLSVIPA